MSEAWFNPTLYAWIPGTLLGTVGGTVGGLAGWLAPRGRARGLVMGLAWFLFAASTIMLALGIVAYLGGQPYGVWYGLGLAGLIGVVAIGCNIPAIRNAYRRAEERQMRAHDLEP